MPPYTGSNLGEKPECPPLLGSKLCESIRGLIMDYHGRAPLGLQNEAYHSNRLGEGHIKLVIDTIIKDIVRFDIATAPRYLSIVLKRTQATMVSLMQKRIHTMMQIAGLTYPLCFVEGISKNGKSVKVTNSSGSKSKT